LRHGTRRQARRIAIGIGLTLGAAASARAGGPPQVAFESAHSRIEEGRRTVVARFRLWTPDAVPLPTQGWVSYYAEEATAHRDVDYDTSFGTLHLPAGAAHGTTFSIEVGLREDVVDEHDEVFEIRLAASGGVQLGLPASHFVTIVDDDPPPSVIVSDSATEEGACTWRTLSFRLSLSSPSERRPTVSYATADASAVAPGDYLSRSGTLTFHPGETFLHVSVPVRDDPELEPDEVVRLLLSDVSYATLPDPEGAGTILANDAMPLARVNGQLTHGTTFTGNLGPADGTPDEDYYALVPDPGASLEVLIEGTGRVAPALIDVNCSGLSPLGPTIPGTGSVVSVRSEGSSPAPYAIETARLRIRASDCGVFPCTADDAYRITMRDTTYSVERVVHDETQSSVLIVQNRTDSTVFGTFRLFRPDGTMVNTLFGLKLNARGSEVIDLGGFMSGTASLTLTHNGPYGALAGKVVVIEPSTGLVSESPLQHRRR
jgi:Calx-beta domain